MNRVIRIATTAALSVCVILFVTGCSQDITNTGSSVNINADSNWVFSAIRSNPQSPAGPSLNGSYNVSFQKNNLVVYLPYFGRAYAGADVFSNKSPLDFTSKSFSLTHLISKKGNLEITIKPDDYREVQTMNLTVYKNGSANLRVTMTSRSPISFDGTVTQRQ